MSYLFSRRAFLGGLAAFSSFAFYRPKPPKPKPTPKPTPSAGIYSDIYSDVY